MSKVVEVHLGSGYGSREIFKATGDTIVVCLDIAEEGLKYINEHSEAVVVRADMSGLSTPFPLVNESVDRMYMYFPWGTLLYGASVYEAHKAYNFWSEIWRVLKPEGEFTIVYEAIDDTWESTWKHSDQGFIEDKRFPGVTSINDLVNVYLSKNAISECAIQCGFTVSQEELNMSNVYELGSNSAIGAKQYDNMFRNNFNRQLRFYRLTITK